MCQPRPRWRGFSFALHLLRMQGFYFAILQYSPIQSFTARFVPFMQLYHQRNKTKHRSLQGLSLRFAQFYRRVYQTDTSGYNATCATLERITAPGRPPARARYHRRTGRCTAQRRPPIIIMYIRARRCYGSMPDGAADHRPCQRGGVSSCRLRIRWQVLAHCQQYRPGAPAEGSASPPVQGQPGGLQSGTGSAVRPGILVLSTRRGSPAAGARNHWRLPPQLFSGFRPIANRGQQ